MRGVPNLWGWAGSRMLVGCENGIGSGHYRGKLVVKHNLRRSGLHEMHVSVELIGEELFEVLGQSTTSLAE